MEKNNIECNNDCNSCQSVCFKKCPICGGTAIRVPVEPILSLTDYPKIRINSNHYICINAKCDNVYFDEDGTYNLNKEIVKVPVWFKSKMDDYIVCYCKNIYLKDIIKAVLKIDDVNKDNIIKYLGKDNIESNCLVNNPIGKDCEKLFANAIEYALKIKNNKLNNPGKKED